jgi:hypothetical protein
MSTRIRVLCCVAAIALMGCPPARKQTPEQQKLKAQFDALQDSMNQKAKATEEQYGRMSVPELIADLERAAAQGREPFNSSAFREIIKRRDAAEPLLASIKEPSRKEFFKLMALKKLNADLYARVPPRTGAAILTDALAKSETFNAWGIPNTYWESSAKAIVEYGSASVPYLEKLLDDKRPAPMWGSEEAMMYEQYKFRVRDYALALLNAIDRADTPLPVSPQARDSLIDAYRRQRPR